MAEEKINESADTARKITQNGTCRGEKNSLIKTRKVSRNVEQLPIV